ncbi:hypothetical protein GCM10023205_84790 [Yinghuangia aomiensis]|uniref:TrbL/VirB6 plasmid conjugal transfer protein n=1 Tax=Yinghuangia aomiensis TaxID=676205 RepID=A0ABP9IHM7_9ACTN
MSAVRGTPHRRRRLACLFGALAVALLAGLFTAAPAGAEDKRDADAKFADGCVYVPQNIDGSRWRFFCPGDKADINNWVTIRDEKGQVPEGNRKLYLDSVGWVFELKGSDAYKAMASAQLEWIPDEPSWLLSKDEPGGKSDVDPSKKRKDPQPTKHDYSVQSLIDNVKTGVQGPCEGFMNQVIKDSGKKMTCVDPRFNYPCPSSLDKTLQAKCKAQNSTIIDKLHYDDEPKGSACKDGQGEAVCDTTAPGDNSQGTDDTLVTTSDSKIGGPSFLDDPPGWTKYHLANASAQVMTWWIHADDPVIKGDTKYNSEQTVDFVVRYTNVITYTLAILSVIIAGVRMILTRNGAPAREVAQSLVTLLLVGGLSVTVVSLCVKASAAFTDWFVVAGLNPNGIDHHADVHTQANQSLDAAVKAFGGSTTDMNFFLFLLASAFIIIGSLTQFFYMIARFFVVTALTGTITLAAAASNTERGKQWFQQHIGYLIAFIFVKPAAVIVFVIGARLWAPRGNADLDAAAQFKGFFIILMITLLLPGMVRVIFTIVAPASHGEDANVAAGLGAVVLGAKATRAGLGVGLGVGAKIAGAGKGAVAGLARARSSQGGADGDSGSSGPPGGSNPDGGSGGAASSGSLPGGDGSGGSPRRSVPDGPGNSQRTAGVPVSRSPGTGSAQAELPQETLAERWGNAAGAIEDARGMDPQASPADVAARTGYPIPQGTAANGWQRWDYWRRHVDSEVQAFVSGTGGRQPDDATMRDIVLTQTPRAGGFHMPDGSTSYPPT